MKSKYSVKTSPKSQVTLPQKLQEQVQSGSCPRAGANVGGKLCISDKLPIEKHSGTLAHAWTKTGEDASVHTRTLRNSI